MPRRRPLSRRRVLALKRKYGWNWRQALARTRGNIAYGAKYIANPVIWTGKKIYQNPRGAAAVAGAAGLGTALAFFAPAGLVAALSSPVLPMAMTASQIGLTYFGPTTKYNPIVKRFSPGLSAAHSAFTLVSGGLNPLNLIGVPVGLLESAQLYQNLGPKRQ